MIKQMFKRMAGWLGKTGLGGVGRIRSAERKLIEESRRKLLASGATFGNDGVFEVQGVKFHNSYETFPWVLWEVICAESYGFSMQGQWVVIDVGANAGAAALWLGRSPNVVKVYAMEPVKPTYDMMLANLQLNPAIAAKVEPMMVGLGGKREVIEVPFHPVHAKSISSKHTFDSCFKPQSIEKLQIEAAADALAPLVARHKTEKIFLKVDCEGAEYDVLPNLAAAGLLEQLNVLIIEWHGGEPQSLISILEKHGFFCFTEWTRRDRWQIGFIKAVNTRKN